MHDERLAAKDTAPEFTVDTGATAKKRSRRKTGDKRTRQVVLGLTGLLGAAWAVVIASRYAEFIPH